MNSKNQQSFIGQQMGVYKLEERLGVGGMGEVYLARDKSLARKAAEKLLRYFQDAELKQRFHREAQAVARLNHPNIVTVFDFGDSGGLFYFLMEYVDGVNLRDSIQDGRLSPEQALAIVAQICDALQFAHDEGVVHRDVKPENVLLDKRGRVKIADFGLAKLLGKSASDLRLTYTRQVMGTPHYMAPEQLKDPLQVDHRADIYSLGVVFYELLTGELPMGRFQKTSQRVKLDIRLDPILDRKI